MTKWNKETNEERFEEGEWVTVMMQRDSVEREEWRAQVHMKTRDCCEIVHDAGVSNKINTPLPPFVSDPAKLYAIAKVASIAPRDHHVPIIRPMRLSAVPFI